MRGGGERGKGRTEKTNGEEEEEVDKNVMKNIKKRTETRKERNSTEGQREVGKS